MNCSRIQSLLSAYTDRELTGVEMFLVRQHISECPACRAEQQELFHVKSVLGSIEVAEPCADFEARLIASVIGFSPEPIIARQARSVGGLIVTSLAAAAAICIFYTVRSTDVPRAPIASVRESGRGPSTPKPPSLAVTMQRDSAVINSSDPLAGPQVAVAAGYGAP